MACSVSSNEWFSLLSVSSAEMALKLISQSSEQPMSVLKPGKSVTVIFLGQTSVADSGLNGISLINPNVFVYNQILPCRVRRKYYPFGCICSPSLVPGESIFHKKSLADISGKNEWGGKVALPPFLKRGVSRHAKSRGSRLARR